jgi:lipoprotein-anchoring transpeptidase ErfK/SrfK
VGEFQLTSRVAQPPWYRADGKTIPYGDPENILGTHWLGLNAPGIGLHGTWDTNSIGRQASAGCVRLLNDDVAELHALLPLGTPVTIQD